MIEIFKSCYFRFESTCLSFCIFICWLINGIVYLPDSNIFEVFWYLSQATSDNAHLFACIFNFEYLATLNIVGLDISTVNILRRSLIITVATNEFLIIYICDNYKLQQSILII